MSSLPSNLRRQLESAIKQARKIAEGGARKALESLAVHEPEPYPHMNEPQRDLRRKLRAQARQLGDGESQTRRGAFEIKHLAEKLAYDQWHRLLFARFLLENHLLISPDHGVSVSLDDCEELAPSLGLKDAWAVAARFAAKELPEIFRANDPAGAVALPLEDRKPLIQKVTGLPVEVFTASDSLGWCYQFWQAERKEEVNASGNKIGADELPAVTQLFTEDYMVDFLLDNSLGAWHAGKVLAAKPALAATAESEAELRTAVALPGCPWNYLRFIKTEDGEWAPAAGTYEGWPKAAKEITCLDPCMGSGHFVVAMFERLVALRMAEEQLDEAAAVAAVICDNLFGLEIDPRCTQIAAFNLALAAWRRSGHCKLPAMNLACSGIAPNAKREDWLKLAGGNDRLQRGMARLYALFTNASALGSLINPWLSNEDMFVANYLELRPLLEQALVPENRDDAAQELAVAARGLSLAAEMLAGKFTLVATNVPYLGRGKQDDILRSYCGRVHPQAKADLATSFVERCLALCEVGGSAALVTPQSLLFLGTYRAMRFNLLTQAQLAVVVQLGENGFESSQAAGAFTALLCLTKKSPPSQHSFHGLDLGDESSPRAKSEGVRIRAFVRLAQEQQLVNSDRRITLEAKSNEKLLSNYASSFVGLQNGDSLRFILNFWEVPAISAPWEAFQLPCDETTPFGGRCGILNWNNGNGELSRSDGCYIKGREAWGRTGIAIRHMRDLPATLYSGDLYDQSSAVIIPREERHLRAIWSFCASPEFSKEVRKIDKSIKVTNATLVKIPFDESHWSDVAADRYPNGLPKPFSSDPTQWLFDGHPKNSDQPLHVAVARLLGYQWPRHTGPGFLDCPALGPDGLETLTDEDGIVCLSATKGEAPAAERLRQLLVLTLGDLDSRTLIAGAGLRGSNSETLEKWLRDEFFEQHCALFQHRPFIWHIWDGHKTGFSALVNYHRLTRANLEKLTYPYLGDWIRRQQAAVDSGEAGSDARLEAAKRLQERLKLILEGEPPFDIFVRWKPLSQQALGWHPDLNDGVRMNIRPFLAQDIPGGKKGAGILRTKPNIKWEKDRGKEPARDKAEYPWFWGWDGETEDFAGVGDKPDGNRWNDCHYTLERKRKAREAKSAL